MFEIDFIDNVNLSLNVTEDYFRNIVDNPSEVKHYKMVIIALHNALELTFKLMISSRNSFMIYNMQSSDSFNKVVSYYKDKKTRKNINQNAKNEPYTITFDNSYKILAYLYGLEEFNDKFIFEIEKLLRLRNALTHHKARITEADIILLYDVFEKCVNLYNNELTRDCYIGPKLYDEIFEQAKYIDYQLDSSLKFTYEKTIEEIKLKMLDNKTIQILLTCLIKTISNINVDIELSNYDGLYNFFSKYINNKIIKSLEMPITEGIYLLLQLGFIENKEYCFTSGDFTDSVSGLSISKHAQELILKKWESNSARIKCIFNLDEENVSNLFRFSDEPYDAYDDYLDCDLFDEH